ncbi:MAG TPA: PQQ-binding-like beta-propeller repeat protein [Gemmataceae bacterium]|jgi:outer membrane protein assembly factor BamB|nr:PQQ-binding-like beta-propeller repeat protein [Gemmataceae bacterium]
MTTSAAPASSPAVNPGRPRISVWPGVFIVAALWIFFEVLPRFELDNRLYLQVFQWGAMGLIGVFVGWWLLFSRVPWVERIACLLLCALCGVAIWPFIHPSVEPRYAALMYVVYAIPVVLAAWVGWLLVTPALSWPIRRVGLLLVIALAWIYPTLLRLDGTTSNLKVEVNFRWKPTPEELFLEEKKTETVALKVPVEILTGAQPEDWPGFRGLERDGRRPGVHIATDWKEVKPREVWHRRVGPGWGSFAVVGNRLFTQEQRGDKETVVCYDADTGKEIWEHADHERFYEAVGGPGPRGTPTFHQGRLYTLGATGRLNCLDPQTGNAIWTKEIVVDSNAKTQQWGFTASPVVAQGIATVFAGGPDGKSVVGYKAADGALAWAAGTGTNSYSSTHLAKLGGVEQILMATDTGLTAFDPETGRVIWQHTQPKSKDALAGGAPIAQPTVLSDSEVLYGTTNGTWRVKVSHEGNEWTTKQVWESKAIKPYFNDMVVHKGYIYGFDGSSTILFTCIDLADGKMKWRERGYRGGQVLLLPDQDLLLILTEGNEVALVKTNPEKREELCKLPMLKGVKSWSHPVVAKGKLYLRNDEEAACYDIADKK